MLSTATTSNTVLTSDQLLAFIETYGTVMLARLTPHQMNKAKTIWLAMTNELDTLVTSE